MYTRLGRILLIIWPFVTAPIWIRPAATAPSKAIPIAEFNDIAQKAGLTATNVFGGKHSTTYILESTGTGVAIFDYDNDGWLDIFLVNGTTLKGLPAAGVAGDGKTWGSGCAFLDHDRDGQLDLAVANYADFDLLHPSPPGKYPTCLWKGIAVFCGPRGLPASKNILYRNLGNGRFQDVTARSGIDRTMGHYCFSVSPFDYDNDSWPDIYIACDSAPSILYHNNHDGTFTDVGILSGVAYNADGREQAGMGSTVADYDGDGYLDLFRTNFSDDTPTLYHNNGDGTFTDVTYPAGLGNHTQYLGWGTMFFDFDNDGWPDLLLVNGHVYPEVDSLKLGIDYSEPKLLYHNRGNGTFADVSQIAGPAIAAPTPARGLAVGDLWNDGRLSAVIVNRNAPPNLLVNQKNYLNHWIEIKTVGTRSNRSGIGARVSVKTEWNQQTSEVRSGSSYISNSDIRVHFGLGATNQIQHIEVRWPSGLVERFRNATVDTIVTVKEGAGEEVRAAADGSLKSN